MGKDLYSLRSSVLWSAIERFSSQFVQFFVSIIIARLLLPNDYGLIAMTAIFIGISQSFVDCGFSTALIRKQDRSEQDNSTVFYFNIVVGIVFYLVLWLTAPLIAKFYNSPLLVPVIRAVSLSIIFNSFQVVPRAILTARADFKHQTFASFPSAVLSGLCGIVLAYGGYGVWALVCQQLIAGLVTTILLWIMSRWHPVLTFSWASLKQLFGFSSRLLVSGLIDTIWTNSYTLVIGKFFAARELGLYSRAHTLAYFPSVNMAGILQRGFFPILCRYQNDDGALVYRYREFLKHGVFIITPLMFGLCGVADPLITLLLTSKWSGCVVFFQILCFELVLSPIVSINNNIYQVKGRSDTFLRLEIYKKIISLIFLIGSIPFGVTGMCVGAVVAKIISTYINMRMASKIIPLTVTTQLKDIAPYFIMSGVMLVLIVASTYLIQNYILSLFVGTAVGLASYLGMCHILKIDQLKILYGQLNILRR